MADLNIKFGRTTSNSDFCQDDVGRRYKQGKYSPGTKTGQKVVDDMEKWR